MRTRAPKNPACSTRSAQLMTAESDEMVHASKRVARMPQPISLRRKGGGRAPAEQRQVDVLQTDKEYLQKEADVARDACRRAERDADDARARERDGAFERDELRGELSRARAGKTMEERLSGALKAMEAQNRKEMDEVKSSASALWERERRGLEEARTMAVADAARLRDELDATRREREGLLAERASTRSSHESELSELRSELKIKQFELGRLNASHAERQAELEQAKIEAEMRMKRFDVLQTQFSSLEAAAAKQADEFDASLAQEREKVHAYEQLELELDSAILHAARSQDGADPALEATGRGDMDGADGSKCDGDGINVEDDCVPGSGAMERAVDALEGGTRQRAGANLAGGLLPSIPTRARRRVRQSILLAQKVLRLEKQCRTLQVELADARKAETAAREALALAEQRLGLLPQPQRYLMEMSASAKWSSRISCAVGCP